jgi:hypothetical protein
MAGTFKMISDLKNNLKKGRQRRKPQKLFLKYSFRSVTSKYFNFLSIMTYLRKKAFILISDFVFWYENPKSTEQQLKTKKNALG